MKITIYTSDAGRAVIIFNETFSLVLTVDQAEELFDRLGAWITGLTDEDIEALLGQT